MNNKSYLLILILILLSIVGIPQVKAEEINSTYYLSLGGGLLVPEDEEVRKVFDNFPKLSIGVSSYYGDFGAFDGTFSYLKKGINTEGYSDGEWRILHFKATARKTFPITTSAFYLGSGVIYMHVKETNFDLQEIGSNDAERTRSKISIIFLGGIDLTIDKNNKFKIYVEGSYAGATVKDSNENEVGIGGVMFEAGLRVKL